MKRRSFLHVPLLLTLVPAGLAGCAALPAIRSALDIATVAVEGIEGTLIGIKAFADDIFLAKPNPTEQAKVDAGFIRTQQVFAVVIDVLKAAKDVMDLAVTQAMADLQAAYNDLLALTKPLGVLPTAGAKGAKRSTAGDVLVVPQVLSLT